MSSSLQRSAIELAKALPPRLQTFLARYPSPTILPAGADPETAKTPYQQDTPNPFLPTKHPVTGKWHDPVYSLRRQAEIVKLARENGVEELLPYTPKGTYERLQKRVELGLRVKGTGVGQKVKGHKHERQMIAKSVLLVCRMWMGKLLTVCHAGWRRGEQPCSTCRTSSGNGRRSVSIMVYGEHLADMLTRTTGWQAELDQVPQVGGIETEGSVRVTVHHVIPVYFCRNIDQTLAHRCVFRASYCPVAVPCRAVKPLSDLQKQVGSSWDMVTYPICHPSPNHEDSS
jgi:large subunit ribosomal protein L25